MNAFDFRLEKILKLRSFYERQAEIELGKAVAAKDLITVKLKKIAETLSQCSVSGSAGMLSLHDLSVMQNRIIRLNNEKEELLQHLVIAEENVKKQQEKYIEASKKRQIISKLKEKKITEWKKENLQQEYVVLDDLLTVGKQKNAE